MNKRKLTTIVSIAGIGVIVAAFSIAQAGSCSCCSKPGQKPQIDMKKPVTPGTMSLEKIHSEHLPMVSGSIEKAIKAIEAGDSKTALAELREANNILININDAIAAHTKPVFANVRCPIMGSTIAADKVTKELIREYKGRKIAFCCRGCPAVWDKLADAEKSDKLANTEAGTDEK